MRGNVCAAHGNCHQTADAMHVHHSVTASSEGLAGARLKDPRTILTDPLQSKLRLRMRIHRNLCRCIGHRNLTRREFRSFRAGRKYEWPGTNARCRYGNPEPEISLYDPLQQQMRIRVLSDRGYLQKSRERLDHIAQERVACLRRHGNVVVISTDRQAPCPAI